VTLCALWSYAGDLHIATDSRLTIGDQNVDTSVKIISFPITVRRPPGGPSDETILPQRNFGLCAAGDLAPTSAMKESIRALMSTMSVAPSYAEVSMDSFASTIASLLKVAWFHSVERLGPEMRATVAFVGHCPQEDRQRLFLIKTVLTQDRAEVQVDELAPPNTPLYFGSGKDDAESMHATEPDLSPPQIIRRVSRSGRVPSVGGRVQFGRMMGTDFRVHAVLDHDCDDRARTYSCGFFFAGLELMEPDVLPLPDGYHLLPIVADPFARERKELENRGFKGVPRAEHFLHPFTKPSDSE
jgi:hypothetical protein